MIAVMGLRPHLSNGAGLTRTQIKDKDNFVDLAPAHAARDMAGVPA